MAPTNTGLIAYQIYKIEQGWLLINDGGGTPAVMAVPLYRTNQVQANVDQQTIQFEGDGTTDKIFLTTGIDFTIDEDCFPTGVLASIFGVAAVTAGLPTGVARRFYGGHNAELAGVTAGLRVQAPAIKTIDGAQVGQVKVQLEVFAGTLTKVNAPGLVTSNKAPVSQLRLSASKATKDVVGTALPSVPAGGAYYAISEMNVT